MVDKERQLYEIGNSLGASITKMLDGKHEKQKALLVENEDDDHDFDFSETFDAHTKLFLLFGVFGYFTGRQKLLMFSNDGNSHNQVIQDVIEAGLVSDLTLLYQRVISLPELDSTSDVAMADIITVMNVLIDALAWEDSDEGREIVLEHFSLLKSYILSCDDRLWNLSTPELNSVFTYVLKKPLLLLDDIDLYPALCDDVQSYISYLIVNGIGFNLRELIDERSQHLCPNATCRVHGFHHEIIKGQG